MFIDIYRRYTFPFLSVIFSSTETNAMEERFFDPNKQSSSFAFVPNPILPTKTAPIQIQSKKKHQTLLNTASSQKEKYIERFIVQLDKDGKLLNGLESGEYNNEDIQNFASVLSLQFKKQFPQSNKTLFFYLKKAGMINSTVCEGWELYMKKKTNEIGEEEGILHKDQIKLLKKHIKIEQNKQPQSKSPFSPTMESNIIPVSPVSWIKFAIEQKEKGVNFIQNIAQCDIEDKNIFNFASKLFSSFQKEYPESEKSVFAYLVEMKLIDQKTCEFWETTLLSDDSDEYNVEISQKMEEYSHFNDIIEKTSYGHHLLKSWQKATHIDFDFQDIVAFNAIEAAKSSASEIELTLLLYKIAKYDLKTYQNEFTKHITRLKDILDPNNRYINNKDSDPRKQIFVINLCETLTKHFEALIEQCNSQNKESLIFQANNSLSSFQNWENFQENALSGIEHFYNIVHVTWGASINHNQGFFAIFQKWIPEYINASFRSLTEIYNNRNALTKTFTNIGKTSNTRVAFQNFYDKVFSFTQKEKLINEDVLKQKKIAIDKILNEIDEQGRKSITNPVTTTLTTATNTVKSIWGWFSSAKDK